MARPTSSSSAPAWAARRSPPRSPPSGRRIADPRARRAAAPTAPRRATPRDLPARPLPPEGDLARRRGRSPSTPATTPIVGGNSKFYGAVLLRYRAEDFARARATSAASPPAGRSPTRTWSPGTRRPKQLYQVRGDVAGDPTEPPHSGPYPFPPVPDEPDIAAPAPRPSRRRACTRLACRWAWTSTRWLARAPTPWDAFPNTTGAKSDAESCGLAEALKHPNVTPADRHAGHRACSPKGGGSPGSRSNGRRPRDAHAPRLVVPLRRGGAVGGAAAGLGERRPSDGARQPLRSGRAQLHEPQPDRHDRLQPASAGTGRSTRRPSRSTTST